MALLCRHQEQHPLLSSTETRETYSSISFILWEGNQSCLTGWLQEGLVCRPSRIDRLRREHSNGRTLWRQKQWWSSRMQQDPLDKIILESDDALKVRLAFGCWYSSISWGPSDCLSRSKCFASMEVLFYRCNKACFLTSKNPSFLLSRLDTQILLCESYYSTWQGRSDWTSFTSPSNSTVGCPHGERAATQWLEQTWLS
jgi:hypothetical protein